MLCYDCYTFKTMILKVGHIVWKVTIQNYFYHMLSGLVKNRMGSSSRGKKEDNPEF